MADFGRDMQNRAGEIQRIVAEARAESSSADYAVKVVVGPGGAVHDVEVTGRAGKYTARELGELIVAQLREANRAMGVELTARLSEVMGGPAPEVSTSLPTAEELRRLRERNERDLAEEQ
ncbi:hypothetical protein Afil01_66140 [Actinorhabdospora filicis]|uniref:YbaB/EbfC DNA-binding family protein n=1 Tax=Actinorhabdospora filicis TaxID=1785913 RepID=A0A9W6ST17_9ACTN|nr:YbaB/EbfC family nucleoid-associated protein [Actinorhabdospora filicis]GLZ81807.1 hypothetical protein Afil01_66140 [Actinorhabdospora filicis]